MAVRKIGTDARGREIWRVDYREGGAGSTRRRVRIVGTRREALALAADVAARKINQRAGVAGPARPLAEAAEEYLRDLEVDHRWGYVRNVRRTLATVGKLVGRASTEALTAAWLERYRQKRARTVSARTCNQEIAEVRAFLAAEVRKGHLEANPATRLRNLRETKHPARWLRPAEYAALWEAAKPAIRDAMDVLVTTGMRLGELRALAPEQVVAGSIELRERKARDWLVQPAGPLLLAVLSPRLRDIPWPYLSRLSNHLAALRARMGLPRIGAHALRHTCACWLVAAGVDLYRVKSWLGHSSVVTTERYARLVLGFDWAKEARQLPDRTRKMVAEAVSTLRPGSAPTAPRRSQRVASSGRTGDCRKPARKGRKERKSRKR